MFGNLLKGQRRYQDQFDACVRSQFRAVRDVLAAQHGYLEAGKMNQFAIVTAAMAVCLKFALAAAKVVDINIVVIIEGEVISTSDVEKFTEKGGADE